MGNERYKKIIDKQSKIYDRDRVKHYFIKTSDNFLRIIPEGKSILDAGCGTGLYTIKFIKNGRPAIGVDFSKEMVDISKKNAEQAGIKCDFILCDIERGISINHKFDYVLLGGNWEYLENPENVLMNIRKVLRNGGKVVINTPNMLAFPLIVLLEKLKLKLAPAFWHFNSSSGNIKKLSENTGFKLERTMFGYYGLDKIFILRK